MANKNLRIKELCKEKGITLECLANKLNIRRTSLAQAMSRNNFSIDKLGDIADAIGCEIAELFMAKKENERLSDLFGHVEYKGKVYTIRKREDLQELIKIVQ